jgi:hypothetical protein
MDAVHGRSGERGGFFGGIGGAGRRQLADQRD